MLEIFWTPAALWALRAMHWRDAANVDAAIQEFAVTGKGRLTKVYERDPRALRLHVTSYAVRLYLEPEIGTLTVGWIFRER